jgi:hypothetical protein
MADKELKKRRGYKEGGLLEMMKTKKWVNIENIMHLKKWSRKELCVIKTVELL